MASKESAPIGRPRMRASRKLFMRNIEFAFLAHLGKSVAQIAELKGVSEDTVRRGLKDAATYPRRSLGADEP